MTTISTLLIMVDDDLVVVNGTTYTTDCSSLAGIHAITWDGSSGNIEYSLINGSKKPPEEIDSIAAYQAIIDGALTPPPPPPPPTPTALMQYAEGKRAIVAQGGISVNVGTSSAPQNVEASTDGGSLVLLQGAYSLAQANANQTFQWVQKSGVAVTLTAAQITMIFNAVTTFLQNTFNTLAGVMSAIGAGTITTTAEIDSPPSPIPAWPANS